MTEKRSTPNSLLMGIRFCAGISLTLTLGLVAFLQTEALGRILTVPSEFGTIRGAVEAAEAGDVISILPGLYVEDVLVTRKALTLEGRDGADATRLQGTIAITSVFDEVTTIRGLTVSGSRQRGISVSSSAVLIEDNILRGNQTQAIELSSVGHAIIRRNRISESGFGISISTSEDIRIERNAIVDHRNAALGLRSSADVFVANNLISSSGSDAAVELLSIGQPGNVVLAYNTIVGDSGAIINYEGSSSDFGAVEVTNNILLTRDSGKPPVRCWNVFPGDPNLTFRSNILYRPRGPLTDANCPEGIVFVDTIIADPLLVDIDEANFRPRPGSPAIDRAIFIENAPSDDFDGDTRPVDGDGDGSAIADLGYDELDPLAPSPSATPINSPTSTAVPTPTRVPRELGQLCDSPASCFSGFCVGTFCCDTECAGPSRYCDLADSIGVCTAATPTPTPSFAPASQRASGLFPGQRLSDWSFANGLAIGDLDHDGADDAVVGTLDGLLIYRGSGSGVFARRGVVGAGRVGDVAIADFDRDGALDILASLPESRRSEIRLGIGGFDFGSASLVIESTLEGVRIADFTNDGVPDVLANDRILVGKGDGSFASMEFDFQYRGLAQWVGDLDGDGILDIVTRDGDTIIQFFGLGDGRITRGPDLDLRAGGANAVTLADLDHDGVLELLVVVGRELRVYFPSEPLVFDRDQFVSYQTRVHEFPAGPVPNELVVADFDGDTLLDVATVNYQSADVALLFGKTNGSFETPVTYPSAVDARSLGLASVAGEAGAAIVVRADSGPFVISNDEVRSRASGRAFVSAAFPFDPVDVAVGDVDGDGQLDLVAVGAAEDPGSVFVFFGSESKFTAPASLAVGVRPRKVAVQDLDDDSVDDIVVGHERDPIRVFPGNADRNLVGEVSWVGGSGAVGWRGQLEIADVNQDSVPDLITSDSVVTTMLGVGDGSFQPALILGRSDDELAIADFDGDGLVDFATRGERSSRIAVHFGDGAGGASAPIEFDPGFGGVLDIAAADADGDGRTDIVFCADVDRVDDMVGTLLNRGRCPGDCNQDGRVSISELTVGVRILLGVADDGCDHLDSNGDGRIAISDLIRAVRNALDGCVSSLFEIASQTTVVENSIFATMIRVADVDRDGAVDVVGTQDRGIGLALGRGDGSFEQPVWFGKGNGDRALELVDFNRDGAIDIVTANSRRLGSSGGAVADSAVVILFQRVD